MIPSILNFIFSFPLNKIYDEPAACYHKETDQYFCKMKYYPTAV